MPIMMFYCHRGSKLYTVKGKRWQLPIYSLGYEPGDLARKEKLCTIRNIFSFIASAFLVLFLKRFPP